MPAAALEAFADVFERWDGHGLPSGRSREDLHPIARILSVADQAAIAHATGGVTAARAEIARRSGGHLDPSICEAFAGAAEEILAQIESCEDLVESVCAAEPAPVLSVPVNEIDGPCLALATFADLKGLYLGGHSPHVTQIAEDAAR